MKKTLLRIDNLGYSEVVNYDIEKSVKEGLASSLGVMANTPVTQHSVDLIKDRPLTLGVHTSTCARKSLTNPEFIPNLADENGNFKSSKQFRAAKEDFVVFEEIVLEIEAQYQKFLALFGRQPDYFEGYTIASINFSKGLETVAERHGLKHSGFSTGGAPLTIGNSLAQFNMEPMAPHYEPSDVLKRMVTKADDHMVQLAVFYPGYFGDDVLTHFSLTIPRTQEVAMLINPDVKQQLRK